MKRRYGTMANQLAVRVLAEGKSKVFVQETCYRSNDEGDAAQEIHNKRLMPVAKGRATFSCDELQRRIEDFRCSGGRRYYFSGRYI